MVEKRERYNISLLPDTINIIKNEAQTEKLKDYEYIEQTINKIQQQKYQSEEEIEQEIEEYKRKLINAIMRKQHFKEQKKLEETQKKINRIYHERIERRREEIDNKIKMIKKLNPIEAEEEIDKIIQELRKDAKETGTSFDEYFKAINREQIKQYTVNL
jgi:hypothetical protein